MTKALLLELPLFVTSQPLSLIREKRGSTPLVVAPSQAKGVKTKRMTGTAFLQDFSAFARRDIP